MMTEEKGSQGGDSPQQDTSWQDEYHCLEMQWEGWYGHPRLNIDQRPIAKKYCEGKVKNIIYGERLKVWTHKPIYRTRIETRTKEFILLANRRPKAGGARNQLVSRIRPER